MVAEIWVILLAGILSDFSISTADRNVCKDGVRFYASGGGDGRRLCVMEK